MALSSTTNNCWSDSNTDLFQQRGDSVGRGRYAGDGLRDSSWGHEVILCYYDTINGGNYDNMGVDLLRGTPVQEEGDERGRAASKGEKVEKYTTFTRGISSNIRESLYYSLCSSQHDQISEPVPNFRISHCKIHLQSLAIKMAAPKSFKTGVYQ